MTVLVERMRESRSATAVLRSKLILFRGRKPEGVALVFEGVDDVGVFREWFRTLGFRCAYEPIPGEGKRQLLTLLSELRAVDSPLLVGTWFFVDHDFDGLAGITAGPEVYVTGYYSIESYFACEEMLESFLVDELRCSGELQDRMTVHAAFRRFEAQVQAELAPVNARLLAAKKHRINIVERKDSLGRSLKVELGRCSLVDTPDELVVLSRELLDEELQEALSTLAISPLRNACRGKWLFHLFKKWLEVLYCDRKSDSPALFSKHHKNLGRSPQALDMATFAARCTPPDNLDVFLGPIRDYCAAVQNCSSKDGSCAGRQGQV